MKKILAILLTVCMVVCMIPGAAFADAPAGWSTQISDAKAYNKDTQKTGYDYKVDGTTLYIATAKGLAWYANSNNFSTYTTIVLENDINLSAYAWDKTIGNDTTAFTASFDGNNKTITGLKMEDSTSTVAGLFGQTGTNAIIQNLKVTGTTIKCTNNTSVVGGLIGKITGSTKVIDCNITPSTLTAGANGKIGVIAGDASGDSAVLDVISTNSTSASIPAVGGKAKKLTVRTASFGAPVKAETLEAYASTLTEAEAETVTLSNSSKVTTLNTSTSATLTGAMITTMNLTGTETSNYTINVTADSSIITLNCGNRTPSGSVTSPAILNVTKATNTATVFAKNSDALKLLFGADANVTVDSKTDTSGTLNTYTVEYQAQIGSTKYKTVEEAFTAAKTAGTATIKLTGANLTAEANKLTDAAVDSGNITIDVNGHNFTLAGTVTCYGNLIIKDTAATKGLVAIPEANNIKEYGGKLQLQNGKYASDPTAYVDTTFYKVEGTANPYTVSPKAKVNINDSKISVTAIPNQKYSKYTSKYEPKPVIKYNGITLAEGSDYTLTYRNNTNIGTAYIDIKGIGNYEGTRTVSFNIVGDNALSNYTVYIPNIADQAYTGTYVKPYVSVYYGGATAVTARTLLTEGVHYTLSYTSNINAGTATVTVTGRGIYSGTVTKNFNIKYNLSNATVTTTPATYAYDGRIKQPAVTVKIGYVTVPASDYIVTYSNNLKVGTATATVTAKTYGKSMGSNMAYFTITGKDGVITPEYAEYRKKTTKSKPFAIKIVSNTTDGTGYSYVSSDTSVATVSANGTVTPVGCGRTVITITTTGNRAYNPATATVTVTVKPTKGIVTSLKSTGKGKMVVRYKKESPNADYYQIRYGRAGNYDIRTVKNTSARTGKSTIKGLQSDKKYFIKVRGVKELADGTVLYGSWSKVKNAVTK